MQRPSLRSAPSGERCNAFAFSRRGQTGVGRVGVAQTRTWAATAARRGFDARWNSTGADVPRQVQALVRLTFVSADPLVGIQQQDVDGYLEELPQLVALGVGEQRFSFILQHKNRAARFHSA